MFYTDAKKIKFLTVHTSDCLSGLGYRDWSFAIIIFLIFN